MPHMRVDHRGQKGALDPLKVTGLVVAGHCDQMWVLRPKLLRAVHALKPCSLFHSPVPTFLVFLSLHALLI